MPIVQQATADKRVVNKSICASQQQGQASGDSSSFLDALNHASKDASPASSNAHPTAPAKSSASAKSAKAGKSAKSAAKRQAQDPLPDEAEPTSHDKAPQPDPSVAQDASPVEPSSDAPPASDAQPEPTDPTDLTTAAALTATPPAPISPTSDSPDSTDSTGPSTLAQSTSLDPTTIQATASDGVAKGSPVMQTRTDAKSAQAAPKFLDAGPIDSHADGASESTASPTPPATIAQPQSDPGVPSDAGPAPKSTDHAPKSADPLPTPAPALMTDPTPKAIPNVTSSAPAHAPTPAPEARFAEANLPTLVTSIRSQLLPDGGTMQIRLDPPELGALQVLVHMKDGALTASFQTSNDDATTLLSHSLNQLKHSLESAGLSVEKLQVQQSPRSDMQSNDDPNRNAHNDPTAQQEQQRKEMLRRMWRKLGLVDDPLDLMA